MPQNMYSLLIQDVLVNREKYANAYKSQPKLSCLRALVPVKCHLTFVTNVTVVKRHSCSWEGFICCMPVLPF